MHGFEGTETPAADNSANSTGAWWKELNGYHWFVLIVAALGWLFDTMDQQLFNLARRPAMQELLAPPGGTANPDDVNFYGGIATMIFLMGWAAGGLGFGILGDRIGRAKTMLWTILIYSAFTGLSALSTGFWDFALYRFLTGLGVGGEFAVGVSLVAEVMPARARPFALGLLQALSAVGNITAAVVSIVLFEMEESGAIGSAWRIMFVIGTLPALLAILIRRRLKEPERWQSLSDEEMKKKLGSYGELFSPKWRSNALFGMMLAFSGVVGLWGIGFFSIDLNRSVFEKKLIGDARAAGADKLDAEFVRAVVHQPALLDDLAAALAADKKSLPQPAALIGPESGKKDAGALFGAAVGLQKDKKPVSVEAVLAALDSAKVPQSSEDRARRAEYLGSPPAEPLATDAAKEHALRIGARAKRIGGRIGFWAGVTSIMLNLGAFFGIYAFTYVTHYTGRRPAFAVAYIAAMFSTAMVFQSLDEFHEIFWMIPLMGFCQLALFGGYAIYFPELFPTHLRSTGTSFCYNVGRFVAASGPFALGYLTTAVYSASPEPMRPAGVTMCLVFLLGLMALPFLPETKGKPLPE
jgi:MFS family permease